MTKEKQTKTGLALLREPFPAHQISKLPKPTKAQTDAVKADYKKGIRCQVCGGWHHPDVIHLDYVGHAALTDRLLDCDENWTWEAVALDKDGIPFLDKNNGLWIKLTVCGVSRMGYGHPDGKTGGDAVKEAIGDALRNAAMRFGAALDLWHKGDLHAPDEPQPDYVALGRQVYSKINKAKSADEIKKILAENVDTLDNLKELDAGAFDKINDFAALKTNELANKPVEIA